MGEISLRGINIFAYHGVHEEERKNGNNFRVDISVTTDFSTGAENDDLNGTIDYEKLYYIISREMAVPSKLIEHVGNRIAEMTIAEFTEVENVEVVVSKLNPPLHGECESATVRVHKSREN